MTRPPREAPGDEWYAAWRTQTTEQRSPVGKRRAGRLLDGVLHDGFPA